MKKEDNIKSDFVPSWISMRINEEIKNHLKNLPALGERGAIQHELRRLIQLGINSEKN